MHRQVVKRHVLEKAAAGLQIRPVPDASGGMTRILICVKLRTGEAGERSTNRGVNVPFQAPNPTACLSSTPPQLFICSLFTAIRREKYRYE